MEALEKLDELSILEHAGDHDKAAREATDFWTVPDDAYSARIGGAVEALEDACRPALEARQIGTKSVCDRAFSWLTRPRA
jgi:hypothetical protein